MGRFLASILIFVVGLLLIMVLGPGCSDSTPMATDRPVEELFGGDQGGGGSGPIAADDDDDEPEDAKPEYTKKQIKAMDEDELTELADELDLDPDEYDEWSDLAKACIKMLEL